MKLFVMNHMSGLYPDHMIYHEIFDFWIFEIVINYLVCFFFILIWQISIL